MVQALISDDDCVPRRPSPAAGRGRVISTDTAQKIATKLTRGIGPGLRALAHTGMVTRELYAELAYFYDLRRPEAERLLDALTRFAVRHQPPDPRTGSSRTEEDCR